MGQVSFSAYLLHFAVLDLFDQFSNVLHTRATGLEAIAAFVAGWGIAVPITYALSWISHRIIEQPMINAGKALIRAKKATSVPSAKGA
jgi:peptidoglycan/LPS O-acetylase OafA/YrhL